LALLMRDDQTQASEGSAERSLAQAAAESLMYNTWCSRRAYSCITVFKPLAEEAVGEESPHTRMSSRRNALCATTRSSVPGTSRSAPNAVNSGSLPADSNRPARPVDVSSGMCDPPVVHAQSCSEGG
jgi:hypothetical protein